MPKQILRCGLTLMVGALFPAASQAGDRAQQRVEFRRALDAVEHGRDWKVQAAELENYPLLPVLQAIELTRKLDKLKHGDIDAFAARWPGSLAADDLRRDWLLTKADGKQWKDFLAGYVANGNRVLGCHQLAARLAGGEELDYAVDIKPWWDENRAVPLACDPALDWATKQGLLATEAVWQRVDRGVLTAQAGMIDPLVARLPQADRAVAARLALALRDPAAALKQANKWPDDVRHRTAAVTALARLARRDSSAAAVQYAALQARLKFSEADRGTVDAAFALYRATEFDADALSRLANVPLSAQTDATREWRVRVALAGSDWPAALAALEALSDTQKADAEWRYLRARVLRKLARDDEAESLLIAVAGEANFFGFLAADWTDRPYAICPLSLAADRAVERELRDASGLDRAFEWRAVGHLREARREWDYSLAKLNPEQRRLAADLAYREGWFDRAVFALNKGDELKLYEQRFPLAREPQIRRASHETGLDPAWTYAIIRAESAWVEDARSGADAYGLMQLLPGTASIVAKNAKIPYSRAEDLFHADTNIALGTRYLAQMAEKFQGAPWLASAAYNAGPGAVERWLATRGQLEPDFFIASIPYKETREYVARVLAFSVIYDWRMHGKALALAARLPRYGQAYAAPGKDAARKTVVCPGAVAGSPPVATSSAAAPAAPAR